MVGFRLGVSNYESTLKECSLQLFFQGASFFIKAIRAMSAATFATIAAF